MSHNRIPQEDLVSDLERVAEELGRTPTKVEYDRNGEYSAQTLYNRFGSWSDAVREAGLTPRKESRNHVSANQIEMDLRRVAEQLDKAPTQKEYDEHGRHTHKTAQRRFGSWNEALREAGLEPSSKYNRAASKEDLLADIQEVAEELGNVPEWGDYKELGDYSVSTITKRFDGYNEAIREAGLRPVNDATDEELLADLVDIAGELGHPPSTSEYDQDGEYASSTIRKRFSGKWRVLSTEAYEISKEEARDSFNKQGARDEDFAP